ncbi:hypothetical protein VNO78_29034 [Psophocarpus tetragonolobus]|uniref:Ultraviolet-B-repressible protein n=1 Tax=Psophocarpus tetragonolobus TaxID=3891 RepID=A0AAN9RU83_PSOTE
MTHADNKFQKQNDTTKMASVSVSMALPLTSATKTTSNLLSSEPFFKPSPKRTVVKNSGPKPNPINNIQASFKENAVKGLTAAAVTSYMLIPEVAHAASNDFSPSLKNFLLSIAAGGVVLVAIFGAVIGVANFDPVKRT